MEDVKQILVDWANSQASWIKLVCKEIIDSNVPATAMFLDETFAQFLIEKELQHGNLEISTDLKLISTTKDFEDKLWIKSLSNISRVNRLVGDQEIKFNKGLTVLFGENAAGKSGYVRILKCVSAARSHEEVLADIDDLTSGYPSATISYQIADNEFTFNWKGEKGVSPFNRIGIFDNRAMNFHVDDDLIYRFTPSNLALFKYTHDAIEGIKQRLSDMIKSRKTKVNPFIALFQKDSPLYSKIEVLGASTNLPELERLATVTREEEDEIHSLQQQVDALRSGAVSQRIEALESRIQLLSQGIELADIIEKTDWLEYNKLLDELQLVQSHYQKASETNFEGYDLPGFLSKSWISFIRTGDDYRKEHEHIVNQQDNCIYCRQPLNASSHELIAKYKQFCDDGLLQKIKEIEGSIADFRGSIDFADLSSYSNAVQKKVDNPESQNRDVLTAKLRQIQLYKQVLKVVDELDPLNDEGLSSAAAKVKSASDELIATSNQSIMDLRKQGSERQTALGQASAKLRNIQSRLILKGVFSQIKSFVEDAQWVYKAETIQDGFSAILRSLTTQTKQASEDLLNKNFESLFESERGRLNAPQVKLNFPGQKGQAARRKTLSTRHKLSDILSEGEQKVIALADFLAEASLRKNSYPIIFDDPVNSLDYRRMEQIVERIYMLSLNQQVIVFTHNIWFATSLLAKYENQKDLCSYYEIAKQGVKSGYIQPGTHPRWDTANVIKGRVNKLIQDAAKLEGESQQAIVETCYDAIRGWCEVIVEQELFAKVSQRYSPHVAMTQLRKINYETLPAAVEVILLLFEKCCRIMPGHSQPLETLNVRPDLAQLKADWKEATDALENYKKST